MDIEEFCKEKEQEINCVEFANIYSWCNKAKDILLVWASDIDGNNYLGDFIYNSYPPENLSPIEQIFYVAFHYLLEYDERFDKFNGLTIPPFIEGIKSIFVPQKKIESNTTYIVDYVINFNNLRSDKKIDLKYAIELDGFNYHSNKNQINYDYERENNLKKMGYNVIRFTGSQIFNHPLKTVKDLFDIIIQDLEKVV